MRPARAILHRRRAVSRTSPRGVTSSEHTMLTVEDIAERLGCSPRWARGRYVLGWLCRQHDSRVPRVSMQRTGRRGRPRYVVEPESFERWLCPAPPLAEAA
ncbi:MAG: hypothetical protein R3A48_28925 [Polyangiales bacterium]